MAPYCYTVMQWERFDYSVQNLKLTLKEAKRIKINIFAFT